MHKFNKKKRIIIGIIIICIIGISGFSIYKYNQYKQDKINQQIELKEKQKQEVLKQYKKILVDEMIMMIVQEKNIKLMCSGNYDIWHDAIYKDVDFGDFNKAISDLHQKFKDGGVIDKLDKDKKEIDDKMQNLRDSPQEYQQVYNLVLDFHSKFSHLYDQAENPTGSLINYNKDVNDTENSLDELEDKIEALVPDIKN